MKHLSPSILALAAVALAPTAAALDVKDDDLKLGLSLQLQVRAESSNAKSNLGKDYNVAEGTVGNADPVDFYIRRMRFGFKGTYKGDYKFAAIIRIDNQDKATASTSSSVTIPTALPATAQTSSTNFNRRPETHVAFIERLFKQEELGLEHSVKAGLDYAFFNGASGVFSSSQFLFPSGRATDSSAMLAPRGVGAAYKLSAPFLTWGFDVLNNVSDDASVGAGGDGMCYTTRAQLSPQGEWNIGKPQESYVGKDGKGVMLSLEYGKNVNASGTTSTSDLAAYGSELLVHMDRLTAMAEFRSAKASTQPSTATSDVSRQIWLVQAGYALPMGDTVIEPAIRYTAIDLDRDDYGNNADGKKDYGSGEYGGSGKQIEVGINWYLSGHNNKMQLCYQNWKAEAASTAAGGTTANANIVRAQWQLSF